MNTRSLIKHAAARLYRIKSADLGYARGYLPELGDYLSKNIGANVPSVITAPIAFALKHPKATLGTAAAIGGSIYGYNKYKKWKEEEEAKKRSLPKVIPGDVMVPDAVKVDTPKVDVIPESTKVSSYVKINRVLNWIYS